ncbi:rRNA N6-adenosine-methyltransferase METTL5 isoform X1 [Triticum aestivum]|uniref:rRNA N6-adenosine-methyltransferase METTL5 isoform X1 n=1 Tax=Triticum aestivum TaxID=4565 RepID=UPI001D01706A|nr:rRNA N6-adenosine-methyltransferase METTL5-like isoform X1 [Triticum aestivum]
MKLKQLEGLLGGLTQFSDPKVELEQYATGPHIASRMLYTAENSFDNIAGKVVADFGCGCGTLAVASALLDAEHVAGIDIDLQSLELAQENATDLELDIDLIQCDIKNLNLKGLLVDTVVMNPPFGTKRKGADMEFLSMGLKVASQAVYSLHKTSTREYIKKAALRNCNAISAEVLCEVILNSGFWAETMSFASHLLCCGSTSKRSSISQSICGALSHKLETKGKASSLA